MRSRDRYIFESSSDVYFVTSTVVGFVPIFSVPECAAVFLDSVCFYQERGDFTLLGWVVMPEHFHLLLKRSERTTISKIIGNLKRITSRQISDRLRSKHDRKLLARLVAAARDEPTNDSGIWKHRFDSLVIRNERTLIEELEYIHRNPVRRGLALKAEQWEYSSAKSYAGYGENRVSVDTDWKCLGYGRLPSGKGS